MLVPGSGYSRRRVQLHGYQYKVFIADCSLKESIISTLIDLSLAFNSILNLVHNFPKAHMGLCSISFLHVVRPIHLIGSISVDKARVSEDVRTAVMEVRSIISEPTIQRPE